MIRILKPECFFRSIAIALYFVVLVIHNIYETAVIDYIWYATLISCFVLGIVNRMIVIKKGIIIYMIIFGFSTITNIILIGNSSITDIIFTVFYVGIYYLLSDDKVDNRYIKISIYTCCAIISFVFLKNGIGRNIFTELSNNFVSVLVFLPTLVYYIREEYKGNKIPVLPAIIVMGTCLLSLGRGGIIASAALLSFVLWYVFFIEKSNKGKYTEFLLRFSLAFSILMLGIVIYVSLDVITSSAIFQRFMKYGMYGTGREEMWEEYLSTLNNRIDYLLWGVEFSHLPLMVRYRNNLHNSFFNLHASSGIFVLLYVLILFASNIKRCIKTKKWIYFGMMIVFFFRALTDKIFGGGSAATPVLFFMLWFIRYEYDDRILDKGMTVS